MGHAPAAREVARPAPPHTQSKSMYELSIMVREQLDSCLRRRGRGGADGWLGKH